MFGKFRENALNLAKLYRDSSSDEEFRLRTAAGGIGFWASLPFRLCVFRIRHPYLEWLELTAAGLGIVGFGLWGGLVGPKNPLGAVGIILLANAVVVPVALTFMAFEDFCRDVAVIAFPADY